MPANDFNGRPFYAGTFTGVRSFKVDRLGRLTGVGVQEVFRPGENVARCAGPGIMLGGTLARPTYAYLGDPASALSSTFDPSPWMIHQSGPGPVAEPEPPKHHVGQIDCSCGYYAYFDGGNDYAAPGQVTGIIEGYGTVTVGDRGFRAEKARLVALVDPTSRLSGWRQRWDDFSGWAERSTGAMLLGPALIGAGIVAGLVLGANVSPWFFALLLLAVMGIVGTAAGFHGISVNIDRRHEDRAAAPFDLIRRNYPDVPVYPSLAAALAEHPTYQPEPVTPETAGDFWEREA